MADAEQVKIIQDSLAEITAHDPLNIGIGKELGVVNFKDSQSLLQTVHDFAEELNALPFDTLPTVGIPWDQLSQFAVSLSKTFNKISQFTIIGHSGNLENQRDSLVNTLQTQYDQLLLGFLTYIPYLTLRDAQVFEVVQQSKELLTNTRNDCEEILDYVKQQEAAIKSIVQAAKDAAAKLGVAKFATKFEGIAEHHETLSGKWLKASCAFGTATLVVTGVLVCLAPTWPTATQSIPAGASVLPYVLTKLAFLSVLYFVTAWAARNYKAHRHLGVVNRHRQNSLSTFETFVEAADDTKTKDAVLLEATRCIFSPSVTGYLGKGPEPPPSRVTEILKLVGGGD